MAVRRVEAQIDNQPGVSTAIRRDTMMRPHYTLVLTSCGLIGLLSFTLTPARAESPPHACRLFSPMELEYAFHVSVDRGAPRVNTEQLTSCLFRAGRAGTVSIRPP